jgi:hypothetical protein
MREEMLCRNMSPLERSDRIPIPATDWDAFGRSDIAIKVGRSR